MSPIPVIIFRKFPKNPENFSLKFQNDQIKLKTMQLADEVSFVYFENRTDEVYEDHGIIF